MEAIKIFGIVLDNASSINKEIQLQFYKILDLDGKKLSVHENEDVRIKEEIKASIEKFSFNLQELNFLAQIKEIIEEEMKKIQTTQNYDLMQDNLLGRLKELKNIDISLEDDFKELSSRIANPVISRDMFYNYFIAKKEKIGEMIKLYNQNILDTLIRLTPKLINELQSQINITVDNKSQSRKEDSTITDNISLSSGKVTAEQVIAAIDSKKEEIIAKKRATLITACESKKKELNNLFSDINYKHKKSIIAKAYKQMDTLIKEVSEGKYDHLIGDFINDLDFSNFINGQVSYLEDVLQSKVSNTSILEEQEKTLNNSTQVIDSHVIKQEIFDLLQKQIDDLENQWPKFIELDHVVEKEEQINRIAKIAKYYRDIKKIMGEIQSNNIIIESMTKGQATAFYDKLLLEQVPEHNDIMQIIEKYKKGIASVEAKINDFVLEIHSKISSTNNINKLLNYKKEIETALKKYKYLKNEQLDLELLNVINKIVSLTGPEINSPKKPDSPSPSSKGAEIGETNESMIQLVESGSYFSVLQGITNNNINKYKNFINNGFRVIFDKWKITAIQAKTNEQRMESYKQLKEIYNQFKSYLQSEKDTLNMLETMISSMDEYFIMQQKKQQNQMIDDGIRYNTSKQEQVSSAMRR